MLSLPVPPIAVAVAQTIPPEVFMGIPDALLPFIVGAWVVLWFMDRIGRLPGRPKNERRNASFTPEDRELLTQLVDNHAMLTQLSADREKLQALYNLLAHRDDQDGIERFLRFMQESRKAHRTICEVATEMRATNAELRELVKNLQ